MTKLTRRPIDDSERQECIYFIKQLQHENAYLKNLFAICRNNYAKNSTNKKHRSRKEIFCFLSTFND